MRTIVAVEHISLDGVMQAPGRPDEDERGGFAHGGWAAVDDDEVMAREMGGGMGRVELLLGRRTYQDFFSFWPNQPQPNHFTEVLDNTRKYVASTTLSEPLPWMNSTLLDGDAPTAVSRLKNEPGPDITILGSGGLVRSLLPHGVIDRFMLLIHPLVLGSGQRLFPDRGVPARLRLTRSVTTTTGVVIATYESAPAGLSCGSS